MSLIKKIILIFCICTNFVFSQNRYFKLDNIDIITFEKNIIESKIVSCNNQMDKYSNSSLDTLYLKDLSIHEKNINQSLLDFLNGNYDLNIENEIKILEKLKKEYINVEIFTLYIIDLGHSKTHNFTEYDYVIITEGLDGWNIINVENKSFKLIQNGTHPNFYLIDIFEGKKIQPMSVIGVVLGFVGIYLLVSQKELISQDGSIKGMIMIFACMLSWGYGSLFVAKADLPKNFFINTGYQMLMGGIMLLITSFLFGEQWLAITQWSKPVVLSMVGLIIFGSIVAFTSFNYFWGYMFYEL